MKSKFSFKYPRAEMLAVFCSLIAIFLSQLPPLYTILARSIPSISVAPVGGIKTSFGRPVLYAEITFSNLGVRELQFDNLDLRLVNLDTAKEKKFNLGGIEYGSGQAGNIEPFVLRKGDFYRRTFFFTSINSDTIRQEGFVSQKVSQFIYTLVDSQRLLPGEPSIPIPRDLYSRSLDVFDANFWWEIGKYRAIFQFSFREHETISVERSFEIEKDDISFLYDEKEEFKFGFGIGIPSRRQFAAAVFFDEF